MNGYLVFMVAVLAGDAALRGVVDRLNLARLRPDLPAGFADWFDADTYAKSQAYLKASTRFESVQSLVTLAITLVFLLAGGFGWVQGLAASAGFDAIPTGLVFMAILIAASTLIGLPFSVYDTFVLEQRFGFNQTSPGTFAADQAKSLALTLAIALPLLAGVLGFFSWFPVWGWLIAYGLFLAVQVVLLLIAPSVLLPLFNTFTPLPDGDLRQAIERYAAKQDYRISGIYSIDGSRRSSKSNAYVTGLGRLKRIALFDTLIEKHTTEELVAVLAHEVGHARLGHIRRMFLASAATTFLLFYLLSLFLDQPGLYTAMGVADPDPESLPLHVGLIGFLLIMAPLQRVIGIALNALSRRHEYEADAFAVRTTGSAEPMKTALRKLSVDNLVNLTPHPAKVWLAYSHPPMPERLAALDRADRLPS